MDINVEPNSNKYREDKSKTEEKIKLNKVVSGTVKTKKRSGIGKIFNSFVSDDPSSIKSYIVEDLLIPSIKKMITGTVDILVNGGGSRRTGSSNASRISYRSYYDDPVPRERIQPRTSSIFNYEDIIIDSRGEAEDVLSRMNDLIDTYRIVSVADLYDLVGLTCDYTAQKYGWTNLRNAEVVRVRDGFMLKLPKPLPIN